VADNMEILGRSIQWNVSFVRESHGWEVDVFASFFFQVLHSTRVNRDRFFDFFWRNSVPLEEYVADSSTPDGSFLHIVCSSR